MSNWPSQKFAEACETDNVSFILNTLPETNGNRNTGFNDALRKGSADFDFP